MASHSRSEPALKAWQNLGPGRIQVQVQQRHDDHKHHPDHPCISHLLHLLYRLDMRRLVELTCWGRETFNPTLTASLPGTATLPPVVAIMTDFPLDDSPSS